MLWGNTFFDGSDGKESTCNAEELGSIPGPGRSLEEGMATHSSILPWRIPWTEEPGGLWPEGSHRVEHDRLLSLHAWLIHIVVQQENKMCKIIISEKTKLLLSICSSKQKKKTNCFS